MVEAATRFGLDSRLAGRLSIKNLSTVIAVAQFKTARLAAQCENLEPRLRSQLKAEICLLGEAVTFFLHQCPGFNKASMLWAQGLLRLLLLFYFQDGSLTSFAESIKQKLRCFQVHPTNYT